MAEEDGSTLIWMENKSLAGTAPSQTTVEAFNDIWSRKGFTRVDPEQLSQIAADQAVAAIIGDTGDTPTSTAPSTSTRVGGNGDPDQ